MDKYLELFESVVMETAKENKDEFKRKKKEIDELVKLLKSSMKENDFETCKKTLVEIENQLDEIRKFVDTLSPEDYKGHGWISWVNFFRLVLLHLIYTIFDSRFRFYYIDKKTNIDKMNDFKEEVYKYIEKIKKVTKRLKKKCDNKEELSSIKLKVFAAESDDIKSEISDREDMNKKYNVSKESADELRLAIFESCYSGEITKEEQNELLSYLQ